MQCVRLPDGSQIAVNVVSGNLAYRALDVDEQDETGAGVQLERFYTSQSPDSFATDWGEGWSSPSTADLDQDGGQQGFVGGWGATAPTVAPASCTGENCQGADFDYSTGAAVTPLASGTGVELNQSFGP